MSDMPKISDLKVGDRVRLFDSVVNGVGALLLRNQPEGGHDAKVVKVGRTLIHVTYEGRPSWKPLLTFRIVDGRRNDDYGHQWIKTPEQATEDVRRDRVIDALWKRGIELSLHDRRRWDTATLEDVLAVLVKAEAAAQDN